MRATNRWPILTLKKERVCHVAGSHVQGLHIRAVIERPD